MSIVQTIEKTLTRHNGELTLKTLLEKFKPEEQPLAELKIMGLVKSGSLHLERIQQDYIIKAKQPFPLEQRVIERSQKIKKNLTNEMTPVATLPASIQAGFNRSNDLLMTDEVFEYLLGKARKYVKMSIPFPEEAIITHFSAKLKSLSRQGIAISVLTREVTAPQRKDFNYLNLVKALLRMKDIYNSAGNSHALRIKDFHESISLNSTSTPIHYESTHAKMLLIDGLECYVGSAEFRINSLYNNFELGVLLKGKAVSAIESAFDVVWQQGVEVSDDFLRTLVKTN
jgi:phosphatidylserine/phosphatidylglycerophosphate/cardiolipin synthase-like enzyme